MMRGIVLALTIVAAASAENFEIHPKRFRVGPNPSSIAIADLNGDGIPDLLSSNRGRLMDIREERPAGDHISYLVGGADLTFESQPPLPVGFGPYKLVVANIDALKAPDVVVASFHDARQRDLTLLRNIGDGLFEPHTFSITDDGLRYMRDRDAEGLPLFSMPGLTSLAIADVNRDGYRDAIATGWSSDVLVVFPGHPDLYFDAPELIELGGGPRDLVLGDLDADGELDAAIALYNKDAVALLKGDGRGHFDLVDRFSAHGPTPNVLRIGDINNDGLIDLVVAHADGDDTVAVFYNEGGFAFSVAQEIRLGEDKFQREYDPSDIVCEDLTGDGKTDIALACPAARAVVVLTNTSNGQDVPQKFDAESFVFDDGEPHAIASADLNGDARTDLATGLWSADAIALLIGKP